MEDTANEIPGRGEALLSAVTTGDIDLLRHLLQAQLRCSSGQQEVVQPDGTAVPAAGAGVVDTAVPEQTPPFQNGAAAGGLHLVSDDADLYSGCHPQRVRLLGHSYELHLATVRVMGKLIWPAAIAMAELLLREPHVVCAHQMTKQSALHSSCWLELGAGSGAVSLVAAGAARRASNPLSHAQTMAHSAAVAKSIDDEWAPRVSAEINVSPESFSYAAVDHSLVGEHFPKSGGSAPRLFTYVMATEMTEQATALVTSNGRRNGDEIAKIDHIFTLDVLDGDNAILDALVGAMSDGARADRVRPSSDGLAAETTFTGAAKGSADEMREPRRGASILSKSEVVICACDMFYDQDVIRATMRSFARVAKRQLVEAGSRHGSSNSDERELRGEASAKLILARSSNFEHNDQCLIGTFPELGLRLAWQRDEIVPAYMLEDLSIGPLLDDTVRIFCLELA